MSKILWKMGEIAPEEQFLPFSTIFYDLMLDFYVKTGIRFSLRDKRLFEITEVEITRVDCIGFLSVRSFLFLQITLKTVFFLSGKAHKSQVKISLLVFMSEIKIDYRISLVIRQSFFLPKQSQRSRSILQDGSISLGLFRKDKIGIIAKFHRTTLVI